MKKTHTPLQPFQSNSVILDEDISKGPDQFFNDTLSLDNDPFFSNPPQPNNPHSKASHQHHEQQNESMFLENEEAMFENFKSQMLLSGEGMNYQNKGFAGETFSQISSTFEQYQGQPASVVPSKGKEGKNQKKQGGKQRLIVMTNKDELLDQDILDNASLDSPAANINGLNEAVILDNDGSECTGTNNASNMINQNIQNSISINIHNSGIFDENSIFKFLDQSIQEDIQLDSKKNKVRVEQFEGFKYECDDVLSIMSQISQGLKQFIKENKKDSMAVSQLRQLEILTASSMEKVREIQKAGTSFYESMMQGPLKQKQYMDNLRGKVHMKLNNCKYMLQQHHKKTEDKKFKYQINEYELNQRLSQLEEAHTRQSEEMNFQANKNEQLRYEKQVLSKNYEIRLSEIEKIVHIIQKNIEEDRKSVERMQKVNNSFSIDNHHSSLLQPILMENRKSIGKKAKADGRKSKENESFLSNNGEANESKLIAGENGNLKTKSIKSQLKYLQQILREYKQLEKQQQLEGVSCLEKSNSIQTFLNQIVNLQNMQMDPKFAQLIKPESSQASVNQAFIGSIKLSDESSSQHKLNNNNNTSFFGFDKNMEKGNQDGTSLSQLLSQIISSTRGARLNQPMHHQSQLSHDESIKHFAKQLNNIPPLDQEKFFIEFYFKSQKDDGNDVKYEDILEISKKTFSSRMSSVRTGRGKAVQQMKRKNSEQESILKILDGVSNIQKGQKHSKESNLMSMFQDYQGELMQKENKNNSTLEMSFNQNEIQVFDDKIKGRKVHDLEGEESKFIKDEYFQDYLQLDGRISQRDLGIIGGQIQQEEEGTQNVCDRNISVKTGMNFLSSLNSDEQTVKVQEEIKNQYNHQNSIEEDILMLNSLNKNQSKNFLNSQLKDFPDLSQIDNNSGRQLNTGGLSNIHIEGEGSLYSGGSSLQQLERVFHHKKKVQTEIMNLKIQDRIIQIPKLHLLDIHGVADPKQKEAIHNLNEIANAYSHESSIVSESEGEELVMDEQDGGDLDKNIALESEGEEEAEVKDLQNMFGDFKDELEVSKKKNQFSNAKPNPDSEDKKKDTLELDFEDFSIPQKNQTAQDPDNNFLSQLLSEDDEKAKQKPSLKNSVEKSHNKTNNSWLKRSANQSLHKKSQSDSQLLTLEQINKNDSLVLEKVVDEEEGQENRKGEEGKFERRLEEIEDEKKVFAHVNFNLGKLKTPKNGIKINMNQLSSNGQQQCLRIIKSQIRKKRSSSSEHAQLEAIANSQPVSVPQEIEPSSIKNPHKIKILGPKSKQIKMNNEKIPEEQEQEPFRISNLNIKQPSSLFKLNRKQIKNDQSMITVLPHQGVDATQVQDSFMMGSFYQEFHIDQKSKVNQTTNEDQESQPVRHIKFSQKKLSSLVQVAKSNQLQKQSLASQVDEEYSLNRKQSQSKKEDNAQLQNYFSAAIMVKQKRPSQKVQNKQLLQFLEKDPLHPYFQQFSQRNGNNNGLSENGQSSESGGPGGVRSNETPVVESQEFDILSDIKSKNENDSKQSYYKSPIKIGQRSSNSCTPSKKIPTISKQAIKIQKIGPANQNIEMKRRLSNKNRIIDQSQIYHNEGDKTEIFEDRPNISVIQSSKYNSNLNNISHILVHPDESMLVGELNQNKKIKLVKQVNRSRERGQISNSRQSNSSNNQSVIVSQNIQINLGHSHIQQHASNPKIIKNFVKAQKQNIKVNESVIVEETKQENRLINNYLDGRSGEQANVSASINRGMKEQKQHRLAQKTLNESRVSRQSPQNTEKAQSRISIQPNQVIEQKVNQLSNQKQKQGLKGSKKKGYINNEGGKKVKQRKQGLGSEYSSHSSVSSLKDF